MPYGTGPEKSSGRYLLEAVGWLIGGVLLAKELGGSKSFFVRLVFVLFALVMLWGIGGFISDMIRY